MKWWLTIFPLLISLSIYSQIEETGYFFSDADLSELIATHSNTLGIKLAKDSTSAELLRERATSFMEEGNFTLALELYKTGYDICKKINLSHRLPVFQNDLAYVFETTGQSKKAVQFYSKAIKLSDSLNLRSISSHTHYRLSLFWLTKATTFDSLQTSEHLRIMVEELEEMVILARVFYRLAVQLHYQKEYDYAIEFFDTAIYVQVNEKDSLWLMRSYNNKAHTLVAAGRFLEAKDCYVKGMSILEALQPEFIIDEEVLRGYHDLAKAFKSTGDYSNALFFLEIAKTIWGKSDSIDQLIHILEDIAYIYLKKGDLKTATTYFEQIRALDRENISHENKEEGILRLRNKDWDGALKLFKIHAELQKDKNDAKELCNAYNNIGHVYIEKGQYQLAKKYLEDALSIGKKLDFLHGQAFSLNNLGALYSYLGDPLKAAESFRGAISLYNELGLEAESSKAMMSFSNMVLHAGQIESSLNIALRNIELIDRLRATYKGHEDRLLLQQKSKAVIDGAVLAAHLLGQDSLVYSLCQRTKNRLLTDLLTERSISSKNLPVELVQDRELIDERLKRKRLEISSSVDPTIRKQLIAERDSLYKRKIILEDRIRNRAPAYANLLYPEPVNYHQVQKVLEPDEVVVEYFFGILKLYALVITKDSFRVMGLEESDTIRQKVQTFRNDFIEQQKIAILKGDVLANLLLQDDFYKISSQLYRSIWEPLEKTGLLEGKKEVIIIPDDALYYLPYELLVENDESVDDYSAYDYLIKRYEISYYPSSTTLYYEQNQEKKEKNWTTTFFGLGVNDFHNNDCTGDLSAIPNLNYSISEVEDIAKNFPGNKHHIVVGPTARKSFLESHTLTNYRYLHFSTHSLIDTEHPQYSRILLHAAEDDEACINMYEIFDLDIDADIISLSSCNSRLGQIVAGEGMIGFTRALMYAGTPTVILSQWNVFDQAANRLFVQYYSKLNSTSGNQKYTPLREVQLEMINSKTYANPYYWSSFVFIGEK